MKRTPETTAAEALGAARHFLKRWQDSFTRSGADDFAQEAAVEAWCRRDTLREPAKWRSFVRTIARRRRYRGLELAGRFPLSLDTDVEQPDQIMAPPRVVDELRIADRRVPVRWCVEELEVVLPRLGALNECIVRSYYEGFSCGELAARYSLPEEHVKVRLYRSRCRIRREFEGRVGQLGADGPQPCLFTEEKESRDASV